MRSLLKIRMFFTFSLLVWLSSFSFGGVTSVSFKQTNGGVPPPEFEDSIVDSLLPKASIDGETQTSTYDLEATFDNTTTTALRTTAAMTVSTRFADDHITKLWKSIEASARASATLAEFAVVQGVTGSGTVEFHWTVSGQTSLELQQSENVHVELLSGLTTLRSSLGDTLLNEFHHFPGGGGDYDKAFPVTTERIIFPVPWEASQEIPVFFDLSSRVDLKVDNLFHHDFGVFGEFQAELAAEFGNSAVLDGVLIRNAMGELLPDATLMSKDGTFIYPIVPEPGCRMLMLLGAVAAGVTARRLRRFRDSGGINLVA